MAPDDALALWRDLGVSGARDELLPLFERFGRHPLLLQALAGEVANWRSAPGDYGAWQEAHPGFDPFGQLDLRQTQSHILQHALGGLSPAARRALHTLAGFRMPTGYGTLRDLLLGEDCPDAAALDRALSELEDRGLLGWERHGNRYDLHPIVRGVVWSALGAGERTTLLEGLADHLRAQPMPEDWEKVESLADLEAAIEPYDKLIGLGRYQEAFELFRDRLDSAIHYRLSAARRRLELLRGLFPEGEQAPPRLTSVGPQSYTLNALAQAYLHSGQPGAAVDLYQRAAALEEQDDDKGNLAVSLCNLSPAQLFRGELHGAEQTARRALMLCRELEDEFLEAVSLYMLGNALSDQGDAAADRALRRSGRLFQERRHRQGEGLTAAFRAELALRLGDPAAARDLADQAWQLAAVERHERDFIRAARLQGAAALHLGDLPAANERLHHALQRARAINHAAEELPTLIALAELHRRQGDPATARELLEPIWEPAERGPYPLFHADALNVLAQIERDAGNLEAALAAATRAYELSWCDGPPYAYHWGLEAARAHLQALNAPEPVLPPFDPAQHEPMPEVEIDPDDRHPPEEDQP